MFPTPLAVSVLTMKHAQDFDGQSLLRCEQDAVITDPKAELRPRRLELLHVARTGGEITIDGAQNTQSSFPVNGADISTSFRRPSDRLLSHKSGLSGEEAELAENVFVRDSLAPVE